MARIKKTNKEINEQILNDIQEFMEDKDIWQGSTKELCDALLNEIGEICVSPSSLYTRLKNLHRKLNEEKRILVIRKADSRVVIVNKNAGGYNKIRSLRWI